MHVGRTLALAVTRLLEPGVPPNAPPAEPGGRAIGPYRTPEAPQRSGAESPVDLGGLMEVLIVFVGSVGVLVLGVQSEHAVGSAATLGLAMVVGSLYWGYLEARDLRRALADERARAALRAVSTDSTRAGAQAAPPEA